MKRSLVFLAAFLFVFVAVWSAHAGTAHLTWTNPTTNSDGSPLDDLSGVVLYAGETCGDYTLIENVGVAESFSWTLDSFAPDTEWCFAASAYDYGGNDSGFSRTTIHVFPAAPDLAPAPPTNLTVISE